MSSVRTGSSDFLKSEHLQGIKMPRQFTIRATHQNAGIAASIKIKTVEDAEIHSYFDCESFLQGSMERQIASNVMIVRCSDTAIAVRLYNTDIITYFADGTFTAQNGGFNTPTTSSRANQFGPMNVHFSHTKKVLTPSKGNVSNKNWSYPKF
jgi:hypothetical protein